MPAATGRFALAAPAKINLRLEVFDVQASGLHALSSVTASLRLADELEFDPSADRLDVACEGLDLPDRDNLVWKAAWALGVGATRPPIRIRVSKRIPVRAGLGGGSADAAAALRGILQLDKTARMSRPDLLALAIQLGSDVPASLFFGLRVVEGTGDRVRRVVAGAPPWGLVLLQPAASISTAVAYRLLDDVRAERAARKPRDTFAESAELCAAYASQDFGRACSLLHNDFEEVIEPAYPSVGRARARLLEVGAASALLCGSGSCVAGFFESEELAAKALEALRPAEGEWAHTTGFWHGD